MPVIQAHPSKAGTVPWPEDQVTRFVAEGYWEGRALGDYLVSMAEATPHAIAVVDGELRLTFAELLARADGAALGLRDLGLRPDDRMLMQMPNCWEFVVLTLACFRLGVIPVMVLIAHRRHELTYLAELSEARAIAVPDMIKDFDHQELAHTIAEGSDTIEHVLVAGDHIRPGSVDLRGLCARADDPVTARALLDDMTPDSRSVALMLLSGGTTGMPKLIARTHDDYACYVLGSANAFGFGPETVYLGVLPFGHNFPLSGILGALWAGGRVVAGSPVPEVGLKTIERERVTATALVPAILTRWMEHMKSGPGYDLDSLEVITIGAARIPEQIVGQIGQVFGCILQQGYGMAEGLTNLTRLDDPEQVTWDTQGRPICDADELMVVDEEGEPLGFDQPGELLTRGPYTVRGYYRAPEQNERAFTPDGWYRTGDIVRLRADGYVIVEGRKKDVIKRGGENIAAEEVEIFAYQVEGVALVAAVAMPDFVLGEKVCLYVVPQPGATVRLSDVIDVMERAGVARFKLPERLELVDSMPTTPIGKIDKKVLRADIAERLAAESAAT
jgi:2,3-dihydroxybenzoate-AMP ligase